MPLFQPKARIPRIRLCNNNLSQTSSSSNSIKTNNLNSWLVPLSSNNNNISPPLSNSLRSSSSRSRPREINSRYTSFRPYQAAAGGLRNNTRLSFRGNSSSKVLQLLPFLLPDTFPRTRASSRTSRTAWIPTTPRIPTVASQPPITTICPTITTITTRTTTTTWAGPRRFQLTWMAATGTSSITTTWWSGWRRSPRLSRGRQGRTRRERILKGREKTRKCAILRPAFFGSRLARD